MPIKRLAPVHPGEILREDLMKPLGLTVSGLARELQLYIVHGLLHLHGFDDRDEESAGKMRILQQRILGDAAL